MGKRVKQENPDKNKVYSEDRELNRVQQTYKNLNEDFKENKVRYIVSGVGILLISAIFSSYIVQQWMIMTRRQESFYIFNLLFQWITCIPGILLFLLISVPLITLAYRKEILLKQKSDIIEEEDGTKYQLAKEHPYGHAHWLKRSESEKIAQTSLDFGAFEGDIMGYDKNNYLYYRIPQVIGNNKNSIIFGASRSGKSDGWVLNNIIQSIQRGESLIVTDTKGDLYKDTAQIAMNAGYVIRVINLKPANLKNSDAWEPLKYVNEEDEIQAEVLAKAIIENTLEGPMEFWSMNEMNCLKAAILLVATSSKYNHTMQEVAKILESSDPSVYNSYFVGIPDDSPAKAAYNKFLGPEPKIQAQILNGMSIRLSLFSNKYVQQITSNDETDLILPMKTKCMYYVVISDTEKTMKFLSSMFFTQIFMVQSSYSDNLSAKKKEKQLTVRYMLDEASNIGAIPDFDIKISTFASRKIYVDLIFQNVGQTINLFGKDKYETIIANCSTKVLMHAGDLSTAKLFQDLIGETTIVVESERFSKERTRLLDLHNEQQVSVGYGKRFLLPAASALNLKADLVVICIQGYQPLKLHKYFCSRQNPIYKEQYKERRCTKRTPKWYKRMLKDQEEKEAAFNNLKSSMISSKTPKSSRPVTPDEEMFEETNATGTPVKDIQKQNAKKQGKKQGAKNEPRVVDNTANRRRANRLAEEKAVAGNTEKKATKGDALFG